MEEGLQNVRRFDRDQLVFDPGRPYHDRGGTATIFRAVHIKSGDLLCLKQPRKGSADDGPSQHDRIAQEALVWRRCHHNNILSLVGYMEDAEKAYLISPFAYWGDVVNYVKHRPEANRLYLIRDVAAGLSYLHQEGIVHGDVKASNVLVTRNGTAVVSDFGSAQWRDGPTDGANATLTWTHLSPEHWRNPVPVPQWTTERDVYAFAITEWEILEARYFHERRLTPKLVVQEHSTGPPMPPTHSQSRRLYATAWSVAERCWCPAPENRLSMADACELLNAPQPIRRWPNEQAARNMRNRYAVVASLFKTVLPLLLSLFVAAAFFQGWRYRDQTGDGVFI